ncbi:MAG: disulfide bond formation protein DsbA [Acidimicrobiaceae bacterium]|nr:disulfide bond formation protein DsbA [Acidimicrobiaceae bacterium]
MTIEVFADIWCPFAHVGIHETFTQRARKGRASVEIIVRAWPLELVNGAPMDPHKACANAAALREQVAPDLFTHVDAANFPTTTIRAMALVAAGYRRDNPTGEALSLALRDALFEEGRNIADVEVLADIAQRYGLDLGDAVVSDVIADWHAGQGMGVQGSPHFFNARRNIFCPVLDIARDSHGTLQLRRVQDALDEFLDESLS